MHAELTSSPDTGAHEEKKGNIRQAGQGKR